MRSSKHVVILVDNWMSHTMKLSEVTTALVLKDMPQTVDITFHGYGSLLPGIEDWGCMLMKAIDPEINQAMILFCSDSHYVHWINGSQVV